MISLAKLATLSLIATFTLAVVIPRSAPPADWFTEGLEVRTHPGYPLTSLTPSDTAVRYIPFSLSGSKLPYQARYGFL